MLILLIENMLDQFKLLPYFCMDERIKIYKQFTESIGKANCAAKGKITGKKKFGIICFRGETGALDGHKSKL
jgi:hypothetical protein